MASPKTKTERPLAGVIGYFDTPGELLAATAQARQAKFSSIDAFSPYPIHGLEHAQGLRRSWLPWVTFGAGFTGFCCAFALQYWTSAVDWPLIVGGKPMISWPAWVPILFEFTILFAGLFTVGAMFLANGLPNIRRRAFSSALTCDRFALLIESLPASREAARVKLGYRAFSESDAESFLKKVGASGVQSVYTEGWF